MTTTFNLKPETQAKNTQVFLLWPLDVAKKTRILKNRGADVDDLTFRINRVAIIVPNLFPIMGFLYKGLLQCLLPEIKNSNSGTSI